MKANPLLAELGLPLDERGRVRGRRVRCASTGCDDVWALGDCAAVPNTRTPGSPTRRPASTRSARRDGSRRTSPATPKPYGYRMLGQVATLGRYKGIADVMGLRVSRLPRLVRRRGRYHLYQLPLLSGRLRVVADWTIALFFRRDIAELRALGHPEGLEPERERNQRCCATWLLSARRSAPCRFAAAC